MTNVFISGAVAMSGSNLEVGVQDPEMSVSVTGRETRA